MLLAVDNLHISFQQNGVSNAAVDGISFTIGRGETFCLVGESGSGKSLTALAIMRLLPATAVDTHSTAITLSHNDNSNGNVTQNLLRIDEPAMQALRGARIAMIFQEPMSSLNPVLTIGEQLIEAIQLTWPDKSMAEAYQQAQDALQKVQLDNSGQYLNEYPHRLSGGQRQRVMIAMAMACEPALLIADEPTTALDVTVQAEILALMRELQQRTKMSLLFITHDLGVVAQIAERVAVMQRGKIVEQGSCAQILDNPQHPYTQNLIASLPENLAYTGKPAQKKNTVTAAEALLRVDDLHVHYPVRRGLLRRVSHYVRAVDGVDLCVASGQIVALVGESGCGKTTLGRAILRLIAPHSGGVYFRGESIAGKLIAKKLITWANPASIKRLRSKLQYIFQDPITSLNPRLTVATTLIEPMAVHGIGDSHAHRVQLAGQALLDVQLTPEHLWRFPHQFSGGQRQRIGIARALCLNPAFIVCDEITSALDVSVQAGILQLLLSLRDTRNIALLFITHDISVVEYISDVTAVMYQGKIIEMGDTAQVCRQPQHPYTQRLIAAVPRLKNQVEESG